MERCKDIPVLVGEGTGKFDPLGDPDKYAQVRGAIYGLPIMSPFKKDILHAHGEESQFYMGHLLGITDFFFNMGVNVGGFVYGTVNSKSRGGWTRGAYYTDLVNQKETSFKDDFFGKGSFFSCIVLTSLSLSCASLRLSAIG